MSVTGEFIRAVSGCVEFLERANSVSPPWGSRLLSARAIAARDLSTAAERVLAFDAGTERISKLGFPSDSETAEFRERCDHMLTLARVITGAPRGDGDVG